MQLAVPAVVVLAAISGCQGEMDGGVGPDAGGESDQDGAPDTPLALACEAGDYDIGGSREEEVIDLACGDYPSLTSLVDRSGTSERYVRFRAEEPLCVRVPGGSTHPDHTFYILDGIDISVAEGGVGWITATDNIGLEHSRLSGPQDIYTGVPSCTEAATASSMGNLSGKNNVWIHGSEIHGFAQSFLTIDARVRLSANYIHNNRNGLALRGFGSVYCDNVLWMNPNHGLLVEENSDRADETAVLFEGNLVVDTQEGLFMYGGGDYTFRSNTWIDIAGQDCGVGVALQFLDRTPTGPAPGDNQPIYGPLRLEKNFIGAIGATPRQFMRFEVEPTLVANASGNFYYAPLPVRNFARRSWPAEDERNWSLAEWQSEFGLELDSVVSGADPLFADPRIEPIPASYAEARARFAPTVGSPLCDGVGALPCDS